jgi:hypothetical protein
MLLPRHHIARQNHDIRIVNRSFENVAQFKYLGTTATNQNILNYWGMHPVARVSIKYQNTSARDKY